MQTFTNFKETNKQTTYPGCYLGPSHIYIVVSVVHNMGWRVEISTEIKTSLPSSTAGWLRSLRAAASSWLSGACSQQPVRASHTQLAATHYTRATHRLRHSRQYRRKDKVRVPHLGPTSLSLSLSLGTAYPSRNVEAITKVLGVKRRALCNVRCEM